jgi:hypothetical protein
MGQRHLRNFVQEHEIIVESAAVADLLDAFYVDCLYFIGAMSLRLLITKLVLFVQNRPICWSKTLLF